MEKLSASTFPLALLLTISIAVIVFSIAALAGGKTETKNEPSAGPFEFGFAGKPGKGDTSFSDAVWRIEVRLYNRSKEKQILRRNEHVIDDLAFNLASTFSLFDSAGKAIKGEDSRPYTDRAMPETTTQDLQVIEPGQNAFLTSLVVRRPSFGSTFTISVGEQSFEKLKAGAYRVRVSWWTNHYGADLLLSEAKRLGLSAPWMGELKSKDFIFKIEKKSTGAYEVDCEG